MTSVLGLTMTSCGTGFSRRDTVSAIPGCAVRSRCFDLDPQRRIAIAGHLLLALWFYGPPYPK